jgi:UDP-N-acetylmuramoylalanine--D-glutamate ligase
MIDLSGKRALVVGLGSSGEAAARALVGLGTRTVLIDSSEAPTHAGAAEGLRAAGVEVRLGVAVPEDLGSYDLIIASPGVPNRAPVLNEARAAGKRIMSELELGYRLLSGNTMVAVTGTNGKTTTTRIIAAMLDRPERRAIECGNIGTPVVSLYGQVAHRDILVCEVSSFQLQNIEEFRARVAALLNLAPDHFDWHDALEDYGRAKARIIENMRADDFLVYNADDAFCRDVASRAAGTTIGFSHGRRSGAAIWLEEGWIVTGQPLAQGRLLKVTDLTLAGTHNVENVMAGAAVALVLGEEAAAVRRAAIDFQGLEHRCEPAGEILGVTFYNDSKATNPHASLSAVASFEVPFVAILGGRNKGLDFSELAEALCSRLDEGNLLGIVLMGESATEIEAAIRQACGSAANEHVVLAGDMDESVASALEMARDGAAVLFTPACASFDMFSDYKDRGRAFKSAVERLAGGGQSGGVT